MSKQKAFGVWELQQDTAVEHPGHYTAGSIECIDAIEAAVEGADGFEGCCVANVIKYVWRYRRKNGAQDLRKGRRYIDRLIGYLEAR